MAPVSTAERAALEAFFKGKRGECKLIEHPPDADCADRHGTFYVGLGRVCLCVVYLSASAHPRARLGTGWRRASSCQRISIASAGRLLSHVHVPGGYIHM